jgi:hypothetical protein
MGEVRKSEVEPKGAFSADGLTFRLSIVIVLTERELRIP